MQTSVAVEEQVSRGEKAPSALAQQPQIIQKLCAKLKAAQQFGDSVRLFEIAPDRLGDEPVFNVILRAEADNEIIGIAISGTLGPDLAAASAPRDDHGHPFRNADCLPAVAAVVQELIGNDLWRVYFQSTKRVDGIVTLVLGRASKSPGEPFGIKLEFAWNSFLAGYPGNFRNEPGTPF